MCNACPLKAKCTTSPNGRSISRSFHEEYLKQVRGYQETEAYEKTRRRHQVRVEPLFGEGKQWYGLGRFRLRCLRCANIEALLAASGQTPRSYSAAAVGGAGSSPEGTPGQMSAPCTWS